MAELWPFGWADRAAIDPSGFDGDKEKSIEALITRHDRLVTMLPVQNHGSTLLRSEPIVSPFSDVQIPEIAALRRRNFGNLSLKQESGWVFDAFFDPHQKSHRFPSVYDPVIVAERQIHHRPNLDFLAGGNR